MATTTSKSLKVGGMIKGVKAAVGMGSSYKGPNAMSYIPSGKTQVAGYNVGPGAGTKRAVAPGSEGAAVSHVKKHIV